MVGFPPPNKASLGIHDLGFRFFFTMTCLLGAFGLYAQTTTLSFLHGGVVRTAQVYVPPATQPSDSLPLVLVLHGFTQSGTTMLNSTGFNALAQQYRAVIAYPNGVNNHRLPIERKAEA